MAKRSLFEQLDEAVQALLVNPDADVLRADARLRPLLRFAAELRDLPRASFKARLKSELAGGTSMRAVAEPIAEVQRAVPYLTIKDANRAIEFYKMAFGATEVMRLMEPDGRIAHAEIAIGGSLITLADEYPDYGVISPQTLGGSPVRIKLSVADVDAFAQRAVQAGAKIVRPIGDQFYGERTGVLSDPFGYSWIVATPKEVVTPEEMQHRYDEITRPREQAQPAVAPVPKGYRTITPYLVVQNGDRLIEFLQQTFEARENFRSVGGAGGLHADISLGDSHLMVGGGSAGLAWRGKSNLGAFHVYVPDCDAAYTRALAAGGTSITVPVDQPYGERSGTVEDPEGNRWYIATYQGDNYKWEGAPDVQPCLHPLRAEPVISFLKRAFGAEELGRHATPQGVIQHVTMKMGDSYLEMGEAHGPYQPMQSMFYLYVPNVDALYKRALEAGATSISEPADQPYGDRNGGVRDPFGNDWFIATHIKDVAI